MTLSSISASFLGLLLIFFTQPMQAQEVNWNAKISGSIKLVAAAICAGVSIKTGFAGLFCAGTGLIALAVPDALPVGIVCLVTSVPLIAISAGSATLAVYSFKSGINDLEK